MTIVYTAPSCPRCEFVKALLAREGIEFVERSATILSDPPQWWLEHHKEQRLPEVRAMLAYRNEELPVLDSGGDPQLRARLIKLLEDNPIPKCSDGVCSID